MRRRTESSDLAPLGNNLLWSGIDVVRQSGTESPLPSDASAIATKDLLQGTRVFTLLGSEVADNRRDELGLLISIDRGE
jgi:hypothetical protein